MNPTLSDQQSLLINRNTADADLDILLESSEEYFIPKERGIEIIAEVRNAMKDWKSAAMRLGLPQRDINMFEPRIIQHL